jgi:uncharacterized protein YcfL
MIKVAATFAALALAAALVNCTHQNLEDPRITIIQSGYSVTTTSLNSFRNEAGFLRMVVQISNESQSAASGFYSVEWLDTQGIPIGTVLYRQPHRINVGAKNSRSIDLIAPNTNASDFRLRIELENLSGQKDMSPVAR